MCAGGPGPALLYFAAAADWHRGGAGRARGTIDLGGGSVLVRCEGRAARRRRSRAAARRRASSSSRRRPLRPSACAGPPPSEAPLSPACHRRRRRCGLSSSSSRAQPRPPPPPLVCHCPPGARPALPRLRLRLRRASRAARPRAPTGLPAHWQAVALSGTLLKRHRCGARRGNM